MQNVTKDLTTAKKFVNLFYNSCPAGIGATLKRRERG
jgi:hypothetical protein